MCSFILTICDIAFREPKKLCNLTNLMAKAVGDFQYPITIKS